jgi:SPP1 family predicted phage head-tail adaptor
MGYSAGIMNHRITFAKRTTAEAGRHGLDSGGVKYTVVCAVCASKTFNKGTKAMREGAMDAYDTVMFRLHWRNDIDRWCIIRCEGRWYQIESFNDDFRDNKIQITAREMPNQKVTIVDPEPSSSDI